MCWNQNHTFCLHSGLWYHDVSKRGVFDFEVWLNLAAQKWNHLVFVHRNPAIAFFFLCLTSLAPRRAGISLGAITPPSLSVLVSQCSFEINDLLPFCLVGAASVSTRLAALRWQWEDVEGSGCGQKVALNRKAVRADSFWLRHFWNAKGNLTKPKSQLWQLILLEVQCSPLMQEHEVFLPFKKNKKFQNPPQWFTYFWEWQPCFWHSAPSWLGMGLYNFGCLPGTFLWGYTYYYITLIMFLSDSLCAENVLLSLFSLYNYEHIQVSDQHLSAWKGVQPQLHNPPPGQLGALCQQQRNHSSFSCSKALWNFHVEKLLKLSC